MKRLLGRIAGTVGAMALGVGACAQSFNIDLDSPSAPDLGGGVPSSTYGAAANSPGFWNGIYVAHVGTVPLMGIDGLPTSVTLVGPSGGGGGGNNIAGNTGDYRALMSDARNLSRLGLVTTLDFTGLQNGNYRLFTYLSALSLLTVDTHVWIREAISGATQTCSGPMPINHFVRGQSHTLHDSILVTDHRIHVEIWEPGFENDGWLNGIQLQQVPEPASLLPLFFGSIVVSQFKGKMPS